MRRWVITVSIGSAFAVFVGAFYWFRLTPPADSMISADLFTQLYPMWVRAGEWMREGRIPLWNPYQLGGQPFLASVLYGVLYPPNLTRLFLPAEVAMEVNIVLHQWLALVFTYLFLRCFCSRLASLLGAVVFVFSGWIVFEATWFTGGIAAVPWLPLGLLAVEQTIRGRRRWFVVLAIAFGMPILSGWLQNWLYNAYAITGFAAARLLAECRHDWRGAAERALPLAAGFAAGIALAGAQLLPSLELQMLGPRAPGALRLEDMLLMGFLTPAQLFERMIDAAPGNPRFGYVGLSTLPLAILGICSRRRGAALFFTGLAVVSLIVALSVATPFFWLYLKLPGAGWFRAPFRILYLYSFAMAVLAALGTDVVAQRRAKGALISASLLALVGTELFVATRLTSAVRPAHRLDRFDEAASVLEFVRTHQNLDRTLIASRHAYAPPLTMKQGTLRKIYAVADYEILTLARTGDFFRAMDASIGKGRFAGVLDFRPDAEALKLLSLMSVRFIVAPVLSQDFSRLLASHGWKRVFWHPPDLFAVYESPRSLPRAYVATDTIRVGENASLEALLRADFDPWRSVVIEDDVSVRTERSITPAVISTYEPTRVVVSAHTDQPGYLVLTDTFYPGWRADVDGLRVPIYRANSLFRAVKIGPGAHTVTFTFVPESFRLGVLTSALAVLALGAATILPLPHRHESQRRRS